ncbi:hypothetical protein ASZ78_015965 [Callipepla squamata]|uniref:Laminin G domain-containing protein n=1 Tax=Callipepla squamata TaxID=9009 RepID=A0A226NAB5_CALSU|nr:hypothetical protein ASZ78_015965 [Callipepla squamata]
MFSVQVDEDKVQSQRLPTDQPISIRKLFVGGTSSQFHTAPLRNIPPFEGCIWNLVINATPMDFAQHVTFENADIGQCPSLEPESRPPEEEDKPIHSTILIQPEQDGEKETAETPPARASAPAPTSLFSALDSCAADTEPSVLEDGKQFGLSRNSHIAIAFDDTKVKNRYVAYFSNEF